MVKGKGQGHQGQERHFSAFSAACVRFMFGKTSLASMLYLYSFNFFTFEPIDVGNQLLLVSAVIELPVPEGVVGI